MLFQKSIQTTAAVSFANVPHQKGVNFRTIDYFGCPQRRSQQRGCAPVYRNIVTIHAQTVVDQSDGSVD